MIEDKRIKNEVEHGKFIAAKGEEIWNWSSPAGRIRWKRRSDMFLEFLGNKGKKVLEIGCGTGLFTAEIAKSNNEIISIDVSDDLIELAKKRVEYENVKFMIENAYKTRFEDNYFDFIVGSSVLHHLEIEPAIDEFYRLLKFDGKVMFTEPNMLNPQIALERNIPFLRRLAGNSPDETAFFRWSIKKKFIDKNFREVFVKPFDFLHPALPESIIPAVKPVLYNFEKIPLLKEIAGSLIIQVKK